jgi:hypothetical protein
MYTEHVSKFYGLPVVEYNDAKSWQGSQKAYRLREEYDDEVKVADRMRSLLEQPGASEIRALIIGAWTGACEGSNSAEIIQSLADVASRVSSLKALLFGEMTY